MHLRHLLTEHEQWSVTVRGTQRSILTLTTGQHPVIGGRDIAVFLQLLSSRTILMELEYMHLETHRGEVHQLPCNGVCTGKGG